MKTVVKRLLLIALVLSLGISAAACGGNSQPAATTGQATVAEQTTAVQSSDTAKKGVTLTFGIPTQWANKASFKQLIDKYNKTSGNTVEVQALDDKEYINLQLTKIATNDCWDLVWAKVGVEATQYNVDKNFLDLTNEPWVSRVSDNALNGFMKTNGKVYAAPFDGCQRYRCCL